MEIAIEERVGNGKVNGEGDFDKKEKQRMGDINCRKPNYRSTKTKIRYICIGLS